MGSNGDDSMIQEAMAMGVLKKKWRKFMHMFM